MTAKKTAHKNKHEKSPQSLINQGLGGILWAVCEKNQKIGRFAHNLPTKIFKYAFKRINSYYDIL